MSSPDRKKKNGCGVGFVPGCSRLASRTRVAWAMIVSSFYFRVAELAGPIEADRVSAQSGRGARRGNMTANTGSKRVGFWLGLGFFVMPYFFAWALLMPGYCRRDRMTGFGWLTVILVMFVSSGIATKKANAKAKMFCSRFAVGGSFEQAVSAAMSETTAKKHQSKGDKGEDAISVVSG